MSAAGCSTPSRVAPASAPPPLTSVLRAVAAADNSDIVFYWNALQVSEPCISCCGDFCFYHYCGPCPYTCHNTNSCGYLPCAPANCYCGGGDCYKWESETSFTQNCCCKYTKQGTMGAPAEADMER